MNYEQRQALCTHTYCVLCYLARGRPGSQTAVRRGFVSTRGSGLRSAALVQHAVRMPLRSVVLLSGSHTGT